MILTSAISAGGDNVSSCVSLFVCFYQCNTKGVFLPNGTVLFSMAQYILNLHMACICNPFSTTQIIIIIIVVVVFLFFFNIPWILNLDQFSNQDDNSKGIGWIFMKSFQKWCNSIDLNALFSCFITVSASPLLQL